jgi:acyl-CoA reductase-like NAD-dependent aldehyde dehydrogenase
MNSLAPREFASFIDGDYLASPTGPELEVLNPASEELAAIVREADAAEVDKAVAAARRAFDRGPWPTLPVSKRQEMLLRIHDIVAAHIDELSELECRNTGLPIRQLRGFQVPRAAQNFRFFAEFIGQSAEEVYRQEDGYLTLVTRDPKGVAALIGPWNAPLALSSMKVAACIAFGNTCVLKPSEQTPLAIARLMELMTEAGLPDGVVNVVNGRGAVTGRAMVEHPDVDVVSFTGGTETGRAIMASAAKGPKAIAMELGGKSANIVFADADYDRALDGALAAIYAGNGEMCLAGSRILVQRGIADRFIADFVDRAVRIGIGDPMDMATELGPIITRRHMDRVLSYVDIARDEGCELLVGGRRGAAFNKGYYIEPTAVLAPSNRARVCQEEIFGPFATFQIFDTAEEAFRIANDSVFGLVSYVWTSDLNVALRASKTIRAGTVWINTTLMRDLRSAFGGYRQSGIGREGGKGCQALYTEEKSTIIAMGNTHIARFGVGA